MRTGKRTWLVFAAVVALAACGASQTETGGPAPGNPQPPPTSDGGTPPSCTKTTCAAARANCGTIPDGCGGTLACGDCGSGQTCGGGGVANVCGVGPCTPKTCAALGKNCGVVADGCGATMNCGGCLNGQTCGGAGVANVCGAPACTPKTCKDLGANCGSVSDGCGGTLSCGDCASGQTCGGGGKANVCGAPAPTGPTVRWFAEPTVEFNSIAGDRAGEIVATSTSLPQLTKYRHDGSVAWSESPFPPSTQPPYSYGNDLLAVWIAPGGGEIVARGDHGAAGFSTTPLVATFGGDGQNPTVVERRPDACSIVGVDVNDRGDLAVDWTCSGGSEAHVRHADGTIWTLSASWTTTPTFGFARPLALDPSGDAIVIGHADGATNYQGQNVGPGDVVFRVDPTGKILWTKTLDPNLRVLAVGTTQIGTVVILFTFNTPTGSGTELLVLEADGSQRFMKAVSSATNGMLAVDPAGRAAVLHDCTLEYFNLAGDHLWTRPVASGGSVTCTGLTIAAGDVAVSGHWSGNADFGRGAINASSDTPFLLDLAP